MIALGQHAGFIITAYLGTALLVGATILVVALGARRVETRLKALEARGIRRRSDAAG